MIIATTVGGSTTATIVTMTIGTDMKDGIGTVTTVMTSGARGLAKTTTC